MKCIKDSTLKLETFFLFLFSDILVLSHPAHVGKVTVPGKYHYLRQIPTMQLSISELNIHPTPHFPFPFKMTSMEREYLFSTKTEIERQEWIKMINEARENEMAHEGWI